LLLFFETKEKNQQNRNKLPTKIQKEKLKRRNCCEAKLEVNVIKTTIAFIGWFQS